MHGEGEGKFVKLDMTRNIDPTSVHVYVAIAPVMKGVPMKGMLTRFKIMLGTAKWGKIRVTCATKYI